jgi:hypothetical protein
MKVKKISIKQPEEFRPFTLEISVESKIEAQRLYALFNHFAIPDVYEMPHQKIRDAIGDKYSNTAIYEECASRLKNRING